MNRHLLYRCRFKRICLILKKCHKQALMIVTDSHISWYIIISLFSDHNMFDSRVIPVVDYFCLLFHNFHGNFYLLNTSFNQMGPEKFNLSNTY